MGQMSFSDLDRASKKKTSRREKFLSEMNQLVSRQRLMALIKPHYPKSGAGCQPEPYRGLAKNTAQLYGLFALANLYMARRSLMQ